MRPSGCRQFSMMHTVNWTALKAHSLLLGLAIAVSITITTAATSEPTQKYVTYGSSIKLEHLSSGFRLHSHEIPYGSGSGQQSVTAYPGSGDVNSYWLVKEAHQTARRPSGEAVPCGAMIRLQHAQTGKNLHSHLHQAPMTQDYEVSAYREFEQAAGRWHDGDTGDNWNVVCEDDKGSWPRFARISLKHQDTGAWLSSSTRHAFSHPISGQLQVCSARRKSRDTYWKTNEGIYMHPAEKKSV